MTQPTPKTALPPVATADASAVIAKAALSACSYPTPNLKGELHDRLSMVMDSLDHLESIACEAAYHHIDLSFQSLYGVIRLISREVKMIDALHDALYESGELDS